MLQPAPRKATYADVLAAPDNMIAELLDGELHVYPRPASAHTTAAMALAEELGLPFRRGKGGPGGWIILGEPEIHLREDIVVPDFAGWRRSTMPGYGNVPYFEIRPDWACEVVSPSTAKIDRTVKLNLYAREGVSHVWLVDPLARTLEILRLEPGYWALVGTHCDDQAIRAEPFDAIELELGALWQDVML
jgi:Uma2 family endonuclease